MVKQPAVTLVVAAIQRDKLLKKWNRAWKIALIEKDNPQWQDLWKVITS